MYKVDCIILAAGKSTRMNMDLNKQFIEINGKPVIYYAIDKFINHNHISKIILVLDSKYIDYCRKNIIERFFLNRNIEVVIGGQRRQDSVYNALKSVESKLVMIHDGARPFVKEETITEGVELAYKYGASSCYVTPKDTVRIMNSGVILDRDKLMCIQTPQCFELDIVKSAYDYIISNNINITDETSALDLIGKETRFYLGDYSNIKITTREDLYFGSVILKNISGEI